MGVSLISLLLVAVPRVRPPRTAGRVRVLRPATIPEPDEAGPAHHRLEAGGRVRGLPQEACRFPQLATRVQSRVVQAGGGAVGGRVEGGVADAAGAEGGRGRPPPPTAPTIITTHHWRRGRPPVARRGQWPHASRLAPARCACPPARRAVRVEAGQAHAREREGGVGRGAALACVGRRGGLASSFHSCYVVLIYTSTLSPSLPLNTARCSCTSSPSPPCKIVGQATRRMGRRSPLNSARQSAQVSPVSWLCVVREESAREV